jgi:hypothetical protein
VGNFFGRDFDGNLALDAVFFRVGCFCWTHGFLSTSNLWLDPGCRAKPIRSHNVNIECKDWERAASIARNGQDSFVAQAGIGKAAETQPVTFRSVM